MATPPQFCGVRRGKLLPEADASRRYGAGRPALDVGLLAPYNRAAICTGFGPAVCAHILTCNTAIWFQIKICKIGAGCSYFLLKFVRPTAPNFREIWHIQNLPVRQKTPGIPGLNISVSKSLMENALTRALF